MRKKASIQQVFIYISALLVMGFLVIFGFKMIGGILNQTCEVEESQFTSVLKRAISTSTSYGANNPVKASISCDYTQLCLVSERNVTGNVFDTNLKKDHPVIYANTVDNIKYNVYLKEGKKQTIPLFYDERLQVDGDIICLNKTSGSFNFWLRGLGKNDVCAFTENSLNPNDPCR